MTDDDGREEPIEHKLLSRQIEKAQKKVEDQNFLIRKRVLEYDDVMNEQRKKVYEYRDRILEGRDMGEPAREEIAAMIERLVEEYTPGDFLEDWDLEGLFDQVQQIWPTRLTAADLDPDAVDRTELTDVLNEDAGRLYESREQELSPDLMRELERYLLLEIIDQRWREHLYDMDYLREGIHLRGFAQIEPIVAYKNEAYTLFRDLMQSIWSDFARMIFNVEVEVQQEDGGEPQRYTPRSSSSTSSGSVSYSGPAQAQQGALALAAAAGPVEQGVEAYEDGELEEGELAHTRRAAPPRRARADRPQRPLLVRVGQEIQEVPWRLRRLERTRQAAGRGAEPRRSELPPHGRARRRAQ